MVANDRQCALPSWFNSSPHHASATVHGSGRARFTKAKREAEGARVRRRTQGHEQADLEGVVPSCCDEDHRGEDMEAQQRNDPRLGPVHLAGIRANRGEHTHVGRTRPDERGAWREACAGVGAGVGAGWRASRQRVGWRASRERVGGGDPPCGAACRRTAAMKARIPATSSSAQCSVSVPSPAAAALPPSPPASLAMPSAASSCGHAASPGRNVASFSGGPSSMTVSRLHELRGGCRERKCAHELRGGSA